MTARGRADVVRNANCSEPGEARSGHPRQRVGRPPLCVAWLAKLSTLRVGYMEDDPHVDHEVDLPLLREMGVELVPIKMPPLLEGIQIAVRRP